MIEAKWLFDVHPDKIEVVVHPQSIVHSMVEFQDKSVMAQLSLPDMRMPIQYALSYPERLDSDCQSLDIFELSTLTFEKPNMDVFPNLRLSYEAINQGGNMPCIMNAANEVAVDLFLREQIHFTHISYIVEQTMAKATFIQQPTLEDYIATDQEARAIASALSTK